MIKKALKFLLVYVAVFFSMILIAAFIPALQTDFIAYATYIVPLVLAGLTVRWNKTPDESEPAPKKERQHPQAIPTAMNPSPAQQNTQRQPTPTTKSAVQTTASTLEATTKTKTYKVSGTSYHTEAILHLATENDDYNMSKRELIAEGLIEERVWKYEFYPENLELTPEPGNPEDPNAIKVIIDGQHVGYIKHGSCAHVKKIMKAGSVVWAECKIGGGPYKYISEEYDDEKDKDVYVLEKDSTNFFVHLELTEQV